MFRLGILRVSDLCVGIRATLSRSEGAFLVFAPLGNGSLESVVNDRMLISAGCEKWIISRDGEDLSCLGIYETSLEY